MNNFFKKQMENISKIITIVTYYLEYRTYDYIFINQ